MIRALIIALILIGAASLSLGFALNGEWTPAGLTALTGILWGAAEIKRWSWAGNTGMLIFTAAAIFGLVQRQNPTWYILGPAFALLAWDLSAFARRMQLAAETDDTGQMLKRHLAWLTVVAGSGMILSLLTFVVRMQLPAGRGMLLAGLVTLVLSQIVIWLKNQTF